MFGEAGEVEGEFAADDQLLQEFVGDQLVLLRVGLRGEGDFERGDVAEVEVGAEIGGGVGGGFVAVARRSGAGCRRGNGVSAALGFEAAAAEAGGGRDGVIDLAGGDECGDVCGGDLGVEMRCGGRCQRCLTSALGSGREVVAGGVCGFWGGWCRRRIRACRTSDMGTMQLESTA